MNIIMACIYTATLTCLVCRITTFQGYISAIIANIITLIKITQAMGFSKTKGRNFIHQKDRVGHTALNTIPSLLALNAPMIYQN